MVCCVIPYDSASSNWFLGVKISELVKQKEEKEKALESLEEKWFEASERLENSKAELLW